jgi:hypothetical protein
MPFQSAGRSGRTRLSIALLIALLTAVCAVMAPAAAEAKKSSHGPRHGGHVRSAWPQLRHAHQSRNRLVRSLARQVGPGKKRSHAKAAGGTRIPMALAASAVGEATATSIRIPAAPADTAGVLALVRSFDVPQDDPAYDRMLNLSFTYDSALAAVAFVQSDQQKQAARLLDQLAALQHRDGSLAIAYDTATGAETPLYYSGTIAWVGLAAVAFERRYGGGRYEALAQSAADWLMTMVSPKTGLVRGGSAVQWTSTQHNILSYFFLRDLSDLKAQTEAVDAAQADDGEAANGIADGIVRYLVADRLTATEHLLQGLDDGVQALDVQALGAAFFAACGCSGDGRAILGYAQKQFAVGDRSIVLSGRRNHFNRTYQSPGPFQGFRPYLGSTTPDVLWMEGTGEMRLMLDRFGFDTSDLRASIKAWTELTNGSDTGLLGSDRTVSDNHVGEYHVWPTSAATSWTLIAELGSSDFLAPS